jgi:hypothetical protein
MDRWVDICDLEKQAIGKRGLILLKSYRNGLQKDPFNDATK